MLFVTGGSLKPQLLLQVWVVLIQCMLYQLEMKDPETASRPFDARIAMDLF